MKHLSLKLLAETMAGRRNTLKLSLTALAEKTNIPSTILSQLEAADYTPSVDQLLSLSSVLDFRPTDVIVDDEAEPIHVERKKIAVAGTGYVGLSMAVLLSQHNDVTAVDIMPEKVDKINAWKSPIQDEYIEKYLSEHEKRGMSLTATTDAASAYASADFIIIAAPTNYDPKTNFFDCGAVEAVLAIVKDATAGRDKQPTVVIKSTIPVGYTVSVREKMDMDNIISVLSSCGNQRHYMIISIPAALSSVRMKKTELRLNSSPHFYSRELSRPIFLFCSWRLQKRRLQSCS